MQKRGFSLRIRYPFLVPVLNVSWRFLRDLSWIWPGMFIAGLFFTDYSSSNPLFWRSFNPQSPYMVYLHNAWAPAGYSNHHVLNLLFTAGVVFFIAYSFYNQSKKQQMLGKTLVSSLGRWSDQGNGWFHSSSLGQYLKFGVYGTYASVLVWAIHEGEWWLTYIVAQYLPWTYHFSDVNAKMFTGMGEMICIGLLIWTPVLKLYVPGRFLIAYTCFDLAWLLIGFPVTVSYYGNTWLYDSILGNGTEVLSWGFAAVSFCILEPKRFFEWYSKTYSTVHAS